jgi:hypothetical protein
VTYGMNPQVGLAILYGNTTPVAIMRLAIYGVSGLAIDVMLVSTPTTLRIVARVTHSCWEH